MAPVLYNSKKMTFLDPNGIVWALSGLSIMVVVVFFYFAIFWLFMYMVFFGVAEVCRAIFKIIDFTL